MPKKNSGEDQKERDIVERTAPPGDVVYEAIYREGEHELERNWAELALSGLAAGLSMGFSMMTEALLRAHLPEAKWTPVIAKFGYSIGFLVVILGRQQLFTKNTLTVILPLLKKKTLGALANVARLWFIVLLANLIGAFVFSWVAGRDGIFAPEVREQFLEIGRAAIAPSSELIAVRGIIAGWLIALMVWLLPFADSARLWVIILISYVVGLADLPHVVAGNVEAFYLVTQGVISFGHALSHYLVPVLIGNALGGCALVAFGAHVEFGEAPPVKSSSR